MKLKTIAAVILSVYSVSALAQVSVDQVQQTGLKTTKQLAAEEYDGNKNLDLLSMASAESVQTMAYLKMANLNKKLVQYLSGKVSPAQISNALKGVEDIGRVDIDVAADALEYKIARTNPYVFTKMLYVQAAQAQVLLDLLGQYEAKAQGASKLSSQLTQIMKGSADRVRHVTTDINNEVIRYDS